MPSAIDRESLDLVLESLRDYAKQRLPDEVLLDFDARDEMPLEIVREMCGPELGIQLLFIPEDFGGMGGGAFDIYRMCEEMARIDLGVATGLFATFLASDPIRVGGTPDQKRLWLSKIADEGLLMGYGASEPEAGSDLAALRTTAVPVEEGGRVVGYKLNGRKQWISNGGVAAVTTILANTPGGPTWFVVDSDSPGFGRERPEDKHGIRLSNTAALTLDDVYVEIDRLVGGVEGQGLQQAQAVFGYTRLMVAAFGLGCGLAALERSVPYSTERIQGGAPLSEKQGYTHKLIVPHAVRLEAARAFIEECAIALDELEEPEGCMLTEGAIAKYLATEAGNLAADASIQALGGYGYTREYMVEKIKRDVRITTIYEGTSEIMEMTISRDRWQEHLKSRGEFYRGRARELEALHAKRSDCGADVAALAHDALAAALERARTSRLTRNQHVLLRLGELVAWAEGAASLSRRADAAAEGRLPEKSPVRFEPAQLSAAARVFAREAAHKVAAGAITLVVGGDGVPAAEVGDFERALRLAEIHRSQVGLLEDMNQLGDAIYER